MGRKPTVNKNLPKGMRARKRGKRTYYYFDLGGKPRKEISLGQDYILAVKEWAKLAYENLPPSSRIKFTEVAMKYKLEIIPKKSAKTQVDNLYQLDKLLTFFGGTNPAPLEEIQADHIRQYLQWRRDAPVSANREIALFSNIWTMCGSDYWAYTDLPCPAKGVKLNKETPRDVYIEDYLYNILYEIADDDTKDAMEIAYLIGQRPADTLKITAAHINDGVLSIVQNKTKARLRFAVTGRLKEIIDKRLQQTNNYLFRNHRGQPLKAQAMSKRFARIRQEAINRHPELEKELAVCQFRDLRAKSGTDAYLKSGTGAAQKQLGHTSFNMTKKYIRREAVLEPLGDNCGNDGFFAEKTERNNNK